MKKNLKSTSAKVLAVILAAGMVTTSAPASVADAKKKVKKPTLGKTKVTINVGKTKKITVKKNKGPKVKKVTIKLSKKQKKIVKITKKTKTYFKVKGLKAGKTTLKVKIKAGKKTYTKKLKVTVKKQKTPVPSDGGNKATPTPQGKTDNKATPTPTGGQGGTNTATPTPAAVVTPPAKKENITLTYNYTFPAARQVKFADAESGYPAYGINVADYGKVIVKVAAAKELEKVEGWAGKCTLSSTDEGLGQTAYTDGLAVKFFNDMPYEDGVYTFEFDLNQLGKGWTKEDLVSCDCIAVQLSGADPDKEDQPNSYADVTLKEVSFILPEGGDVTDPTPTPGVATPTPVPLEETDTTAIGDLNVDADMSDVTTLKACSNGAAVEYVKIPFTGNNERVFFDVKDINFKNIASIKVTADVPAQMSFDLWAKDLDKSAEEWYKNAMGSDYPFFNGSTTDRKEDGLTGDPGKETYTFDMSKLKAGMDTANIGYLALGTNKAPGGANPWATAEYKIYSIELVQKEVTVTATAAKDSIEAGESTTIIPAAKLAGEDTTATFAYKSSDDTVATVDSTGKVTAVKAGTVKITVEASVEGIEKKGVAEVEITVKEKSVDPSVELAVKAGSESTIGTGLTTTLDVTVRNAKDAAVAYTFGTGDTGTATVTTDAGGTTATVKGTKAGTVTVTAEITVDSQKYTSEPVIIVVVDPTVAVSAKTIDRVTVGKTIELVSETTNAGDATVAYSSSAEGTATVDNKGVVTGVAAGKATITATITVDGKDYTDTIEITVAAAPTDDLTVTFDASNTKAIGNGTTEGTPTVEFNSGAVTVTTKAKYNQGVVLTLNLPSGVDLTDYYGMSVTYTPAANGQELKDLYKAFVVELPKQGQDEVQSGISSAQKRIEIFSSGFNSFKDATSQTKTKEFTLTGIAEAKATTGEIQLVLGINDIPVGCAYTISELKLLKEAPTV